MEERRQINRTEYHANSVIVVCETEQRIFVQVDNISPLGMGLHAEADCPDILGKDIIIITDTLIMYATVLRMEQLAEGGYTIGIEARKFTDDVLNYLFEHIGAQV